MKLDVMSDAVAFGPAGGASQELPELLRASDVVKTFGATTALDGARLTLRAGEVHALLGENGAGKSTLIKLLVGVHRADAGELSFRGAPLELASPLDGIARGILPVYQQSSLLPDLTVTENLFAFDLASGWGVPPGTRKRREAAAREALASVGLDVSPRATVGQLSLAQRQLVEIARCNMRSCELLILDEPTACLSGAEVERLLGAMSALREQGKSVVFISHRLDEVAQIADRATVLRDGRTVVDGVPLADISRDELVEAIAGHRIQPTAVSARRLGAPRLRARELACAGSFAGVDLDVHAGEIVGIAGLAGSGAMELGEALGCARPLARGALTIDGRALRGGDRAAGLRAGVAFVPADRDAAGVFPTLSVLHNATASSLRELARGGRLRRAAELERVVPLLRSLNVKPADPDANVRGLSGGNQQKVLVVRSLAVRGARALVLLEPTRGVDVAARADIHAALRAAAERGLAVAIVSSDLDELVETADRIVVLRARRAVAELAPGDGLGQIVHHLTGGAS